MKAITFIQDLKYTKMSRGKLGNIPSYRDRATWKVERRSNRTVALIFISFPFFFFKREKEERKNL